ncbi:MAG: aldolase/citrate lyase family protein [Burkholderiaceae bacterium]|nr:aldolase/citrate lyase family protein [Burkholderiaceae bacterium]
MSHPRDILLGAQAATGVLPVCDHYCGVEARMVKSLQLQAEMTEEFGACVFDVTLDCEDGAPVGGEIDHANMVAAVANNAYLAINNIAKISAKKHTGIAARVHAADHPSFESDIEIIVGQAAPALCHVMVPKVESVADVERAVALIDAAQKKSRKVGVHSSAEVPLPLHVLIESPAAVHRAFDIAAHPRVQSLSFGLMDFVSSHGGAIPASAMTLAGQFAHPLVVRAKLAIASACHAFGKVPSHCVVTEFADAAAISTAASRAALEFGFTRMWSIHPGQIRPILAAFAPSAQEIEIATDIIVAGADKNWAPISYKGKLHDRASYRYYWQLLERAHQTGRALSQPVSSYFETETFA